MQLLMELAASGAIAGIKIGIAALGFAIIFYATQEMHFAFGALSVAAAYVCYWTIQALGGGALGVAAGMAAGFAFSVGLNVAIHRSSICGCDRSCRS